MKNERNWPRIWLFCGLILILIGTLDPLEGSVLILIGVALALIGASLGRSRHRTLLAWALGLTAAGIGILFGMSAIGGIGGSTGRSMWWALTLVPYPAGWVMGIVGAVKALREKQ